jgi:hypothetical protein
MGSKRLILEEEDAVLDVLCLLCNLNTRRPYGKLGRVETINYLSCKGMSSELTNIMPLFPGCAAMLQQFRILWWNRKKRMKARGDTEQINRTEEALAQIKELQADMGEMQGGMERIMEHFNVSASQSERT